jgi:hypothetical protein
MPIHDWTKVDAGRFHALHVNWIVDLQNALNGGLLPQGFYAVPEQRAGRYEADLLTLERRSPVPDDQPDAGGTAIARESPKTTIIDLAEEDFHARRQNRLVVRHVSHDQPVALIELVSLGNKSSRKATDDFVSKSVAAMREGLHLVVADLFPPRRNDPRGLIGELWANFDRDYQPTRDAPLALAGFRVAEHVTAYIEPATVGQPVLSVPLFVTADRYVMLPLEQTYEAAFKRLPPAWQAMVQG